MISIVELSRALGEPSPPSPRTEYARGIGDFLTLFGGTVLGAGFYRIFEPAQASSWRTNILRFFDVECDITPFGSDWRGCVLADAAGSILMFDIATHDYYSLPFDLAVFHEQELPGDLELLAYAAFVKWKRRNGSLGFSECVGFDVPLRLGGKDIQKNLKRWNMEVYWDITGSI